jgi:hypothetical protein
LELGKSSQQIFHVRLDVVVKTMFLRFLSRQASKMVGHRNGCRNSFSTGGARHSRQRSQRASKSISAKDKLRKRGRPFKHVSELAITKKRARVQALEAFKQQTREDE